MYQAKQDQGNAQQERNTRYQSLDKVPAHPLALQLVDL
jgi:hypothetical protein